MSKKSKGGAGPEKTNAARLLDKAGIQYRLVPYEVDESDLSAVHVAATLGEDIDLVYKTLVLHSEPMKAGQYFVCVVPGAAEVDLKKAARAAGYKKVEMLAMKELLGVTGYIRGGCSPVGLKKPYPIFIQQDVLAHDRIFISAGQRGLQFELSPADLVAYTGATAADLIKGDADA